MSIEETELIARLFAQEVPEIATGAVEIKAIARILGYRCKLALRSRDPQVDCVGACVGVRGFRIKNIVDQLDGERNDLFRWDDDPKRLIVSALQPAAIEEVILQNSQHRALVVVKEDQLSLVQGRWGHNRELASRICGWEIEPVVRQ
jgi:N utilization substance protein A